MPQINDYLLGTSAIIPNTWVRIVGNTTNIEYISTSATNAVGIFAMPIVPAGTYSTYTGPTNIGPWTATGNTGYVVANTVPVFNVMDYGAKGDGTTNDTAAINNAIIAANISGGTVLLPSGTYKVTTMITLLSNVTLLGLGQGVSIITGAFPGGTGLVGTALNGTTKTVYSNIAVKDLTIKSSQGHAFHVNNTNNLSVDNVEIYFTSSGIVESLYIQHCQNVRVSNCFIHDFPGDGIQINSTDNFVIGNNIITGATSGPIAADDGIDIDSDFLDTDSIPSRWGTVVDNTIRHIYAGNGIRVEDAQYITVTGNTVDDVHNQGIDINAGTASIVTHNIAVVGNVVSNCLLPGIKVGCEFGGTTINDVEVSNNNVDTCGTTGGGVRAGIQIGPKGTSVFNISVTGNYLSNCGGSNADSGAIVPYKSDHVRISNNTINNSTYGIRVWNGDTLQTYTDVVLEGNHFISVTTPYVDAINQVGVTIRSGPVTYDAKLMGAKGDGTTDDFNAINTALNALLGVGGGTLVFPRGTYLLSSPLNIPSNVTIQGAGIDLTTLKIKSTSFATFAFGFMIQARSGPASNVHVRDITLDGNARSGGGAANQGGLLSVGNNWTVERVRFIDANYFRLWINGITNARIRNCRWDSTTGTGNDNIGGGGCTDVTIEGCYFGANLVGNVFDNVGGSAIRFRNNYSASVNGVFFEGITDSIIEGNYLSGGINCQSNSGYNPATVTNPRNIVIKNNTIILISGNLYGIALRYDDYAGATTHIAGGGNIVEGNVIDGPTKIGIFTYGTANTWKNQGDIINNNKIRNPNTGGSNTYNTGVGVFDNAGIALQIGQGDVVRGNSVTDDRGGSATMQYGYCIGAGSGTPTLTDLLFDGNSSEGHLNDPISFRSSAQSSCVVVNSRFFQSIAYAAAITPDLALGNYIEIGTLTAGITINNPTNTNGLIGQIVTLQLVQDGTGGRTVTWGTNWLGAVQPSLIGTKTSTISFVVTSAGTLRAISPFVVAGSGEIQGTGAVTLKDLLILNNKGISLTGSTTSGSTLTSDGTTLFVRAPGTPGGFDFQVTASSDTNAVQITTLGRLIITNPNARITPGATDFAITNNGFTQNNLLITDAGLTTLRNTLTVSGGGAAITGGLSLDGATSGAANFLNVPGGGGITLNGGTFLTFRNGSNLNSFLLNTGGQAIAVTIESVGLRMQPSNAFNITGGFAAQRFTLFDAPVINAATSLTVTDAATVAIAGAPTVGGAGPAVITRKYQLWLQGTDNMRVDSTTSSTIGAAGAASVLPANPLGYLPIYVGTTLVKIPYYNP